MGESRLLASAEEEVALVAYVKLSGRGCRVPERQLDRGLDRPFRDKPDPAFCSNGEIKLQRLETKAVLRQVRGRSDWEYRIADLFKLTAKLS
jgi:hypothetical protein